MRKITLILSLAVGLCAHGQSSFKPGQTWNDTSGSAINAHGGCVQYLDGTYYWFGETRSGSVCNGVSCYSSTDLYKWKKLSNAMTPTGTKTDANVDVAQGRTIERPKVVYNAKTGKWVMWFHWENGSNYNEAKVAVLTSDKITGPYTLTEDGVFRPNNRDSRDQTLFLASDGQAYHVSSTNTNYQTHFIRLSEDFTKPTSEESIQLLGARYEAASMFQYGDSYWCLFSGCDGWNANRGRYAWYVGKDPIQNWQSGRDFYANNSWGVDFCVDANNTKCYQSQPAYVFPVQGRDKCFIYMGDRWTSSNVGSSKYVWCPLSIRSGYPAVRWYDSWDLSVFDKLYQKKRLAHLEDGAEFYFLEKYSDRIISRPGSSWLLKDDDASNALFRLHTTDNPDVFRIEHVPTGKYMQCAFGSNRLAASSDEDNQKWVFILEEDGYYQIRNLAEEYVLSVSGNATQDGTTIYLNAPNADIHQSFAVYYDSEAHPEYEEADMYSLAYREHNAAEMTAQAERLGQLLAVKSPEVGEEQSICNLMGIRFDKVSRPGLYVVNGKKRWMR